MKQQLGNRSDILSISQEDRKRDEEYTRRTGTTPTWLPTSTRTNHLVYRIKKLSPEWRWNNNWNGLSSLQKPIAVLLVVQVQVLIILFYDPNKIFFVHKSLPQFGCCRRIRNVANCKLRRRYIENTFHSVCNAASQRKFTRFVVRRGWGRNVSSRV